MCGFVCVCSPSEVELITTPPQGSLFNLTFLHPTPHCLTLQSEEEQCFLESTNSLWSSNSANLQNDKTPLQQSPFIMIVLNKRCFFWKMVSLHKHLTDIKISNSLTYDEDYHLPRMCKNKPQNENETINIQKHYPCLWTCLPVTMEVISDILDQWRGHGLMTVLSSQ